MAGGDNEALAKVPASQFIELLEKYGAAETARRTGMSIRRVYGRRMSLEKRLGRSIIAANVHASRQTRIPVIHYPRWRTAEVETGTVLVGSDAHFWPSIVTTAFRGFLKFAKELKPSIVVLNGDMLDGASISRHSPIGWENRPTLIQEIECSQERLGELMAATPNAKHVWSLGNHDARFETRLATVAPEYAKVKGVHLHDHFGGWEPCWSLNVNDEVVIKHRFKGGTHATHNGTLHAGKTIVTGHLHSLKVTPFSDYNGTRWGVDTGTLADPYGPQFEDYCEQNPVSWRSGFVVLTFHKGRLLQPQTALVVGDGEIDYCGKLVKV